MMRKRLAAAAVWAACWASSPLAHGQARRARYDFYDFVGPPQLIVVSPGSVALPPPSYGRGLSTLPRKREVPAREPVAVSFSPTAEELREWERSRHLPPPDTAPDDVGTQVVTEKSAEGESRRFQEAFAARFAEVDPRPPGRTAHYDWLPHYDAFLVRHIGWHAVIRRVETRDDGARLVTLHLFPNLYSTNIKTMVMDYVEETYRVQGDAIVLVATDAATPKPRLQGFPAHP